MPDRTKVTTLERFILDQERSHPEATGELTNLLYDVALGAKIIAASIRRAGLIGVLGSAGAMNVQGEEQQKLDVFANETMKNALNHTGRVCAMASEEDEQLIPIPDGYPPGRYSVVFDPARRVVEHRRQRGGGDHLRDPPSHHHRRARHAGDVLQPGIRLVGAGYVMYGSSMMMVYSTGNGVHGFTLDPTIGEFLLSHPRITTPRTGAYYSVNESNFGRWSRGMQRAVRGFHGDDPRADAEQEVALHRLAGGRLPSQPDRRRGLSLSGRYPQSARQAAPALRVHADGVSRRAGRRAGPPTAGTASSTIEPRACTSARRSWWEPPTTSITSAPGARRSRGGRRVSDACGRRAGGAPPRATGAGDPARDLGEPGAFPLPAGPYAGMYTGRPWTMRQYAGFGTAEETNERFRALLAAGQTGLSTAFDLPTQMGYDSDHPMASGEVGRVGRRDRHRRRPGAAVRRHSARPGHHVDDDQRHRRRCCWRCTSWWATSRACRWRRWAGTVQNDILKEYVARGTYIYPAEPSLRADHGPVPLRAPTHGMNFNPISISGYHMREAGATAVQEVGFTLANAMEYVRRGVAAGVPLDAFAPRLSFFFAAHNDLFEEAAKFRAARRLFARLMRERFGADDASARLRFHTQTGGVTLQAQQPMNNVVRVTVQALAAVLGGTQSLHTNAYDEALALPSEASATLALRTQQVLAFESGMTDTVDPLAGSWYVEALTDRIEIGARALVDEVEALGGAAAAIEQGFYQRAIADSAWAMQQAQEAGDVVVVGVNRFSDDSVAPTLAPPDFAGAGAARSVGASPGATGPRRAAVAAALGRGSRRGGRIRTADAADHRRGPRARHAGRDQRRDARGVGELSRGAPLNAARSSGPSSSIGTPASRMAGDPERADEAWLILHGHGMLAQGILHWFRLAERPNRLLVAPEALSRFYTDVQGPRTVGASWLTREDRDNDIADTLAYLDRAVDLCIRPELPLEIHGFSQGVGVGARWAVHTARGVRRLVCWAGSFPEDVGGGALARVLGGQPVHMVIGETDALVSPDRIESDAARLRQQGQPVAIHRFVGGHRIDDGVLAEFAAGPGPA